ncbi:MAG TPA: hypothetical protein VJ731_16525 [Terriglobales bacterium]|nr:hypothetical protein [Terriglobales bacterium]
MFPDTVRVPADVSGDIAIPQTGSIVVPPVRAASEILATEEFDVLQQQLIFHPSSVMLTYEAGKPYSQDKNWPLASC